MADETLQIWKPVDWTAKAPTSPGTPPRPGDAPPARPGLLGRMASEGMAWPGPEAATADLKAGPPKQADDATGGGPFEWRSAARELSTERVNSGPAGVPFPVFLPYFDDQTGETPAARLAYRKMLSDGDVKSALISKILPVCALDLSVLPEDDGDPIQAEAAKFVEWNLTKRIDGGFIGLCWDVLIGGLVDGFSVLEKVWAAQDKGKYAGRWVLSALKPKQVGDDVILLTDSFRNIIGVRGLRYNAGEDWPPERFLIFRHLPMYGSPVAMSDLRAAYKHFWMRDTALKLRATFIEKRAIPSLLGKYKTTSQKASLDAALAMFKSQNYVSVPDDVLVEVLDAAGGAEAAFKEFDQDQIEAIYRSINGASLQAVEGKTGGARGNSRVHQTTAEVRVWHLSAMICQALNNHERGLVVDLCDLNFTLPEYPSAVMGSVDASDLTDDLAIYDGVKNKLGVSLSEADVRKKFRIAAPDKSKPGDELKPDKPQTAPGGAGGLAGLMGGGGGGGDGTGTATAAPGEGDDEGGQDDPFNLRGGA